MAACLQGWCSFRVTEINIQLVRLIERNHHEELEPDLSVRTGTSFSDFSTIHGYDPMRRSILFRSHHVDRVRIAVQDCGEGEEKI